MSIVHIRVNGREYDVACDDGQEEHLRLLADEVDDRVRSLVYSMGGNPGEAMALLLTSLMMADELLENRRETEKLLHEAGKLRSAVVPAEPDGKDERLAELESAMAVTLEEIAARIEKIAGQIEVR